MDPILAIIFWHETFLSLVLWAEILCLVAATILHYIGQTSVRRNPDDYVYHFSRVWWTTFRQKPSPIRAPRMIDVDADDDSKAPLMDLVDEDAIEALGRPAREVDDDDGERGESSDEQSASSGMRVANLTVRVISQQSTDEIVGFHGRALKIRVTASEDGGQANKSVIELLAVTLGLRPHQIQLKRGHYEEQKTLAIAGITQADLDERLSTFS
ncbi:MAG TPA: DUF167 family protein [Tepidisphaeraceae bacterium]|jgi:hypothetical protein|nr:DUF167 family protein [Tepidisphaeraceae bacterium]